MKVLMVEHFLPKNTYSKELGQELANLVDLTIVSKRNANGNCNIYRTKEILLEEGNNKLFAFYYYSKGLIKMIKEIRKNNYDIIHVQTFKYPTIEIPIYKYLKRHTKVFIHTVHNILPHEHKKGDKVRFEKFYTWCDALIVHNFQSSEILKNELNITSQKIYIIPHGIYGLQSLKQFENVDDSTMRFLTFGVIRKYKGIDVLLKAISLIPKTKRENLSFLIAGKQHYKLDSTNYLEIINELQINDCVKLVSENITDKDMAQMFSSSDACIFPYKEIYGSGALFMAYSFRCPVIVSNIPVFIEDTGNGQTGLIFESESANDLAKSILIFSQASSKQKQCYIDNIEKLIGEKYNWQRSANMTVQVYKKYYYSLKNI